MKNRFTQDLAKWHSKNKRNLPWKKDKDPYKIWISEIILQQTQVIQGTPYYEKFIAHFPNIETLASADLDSVLALWTGLGYYSRARNLHKAAITLKQKHSGSFPRTYQEIINLPGIGEYTASAICSFAYNKPYAVVDANVIRILARYLGIEEIISSSKVIKDIKDKALTFLDKKNPGAHNQAIMDFGATVCTPKKPMCNNCLFQSNCVAFNKGIVHDIPKKATKKKRRDRYFHYLFLQCGDYFILKQRTENDIWQQLYDLPLVETKSKRRISQKTILNTISQIHQKITVQKLEKEKFYFRQTLSHQYIHGIFYKIEIQNIPKSLKTGFIKLKPNKLKKYGLPKVIDTYMSYLYDKQLE